MAAGGNQDTVTLIAAFVRAIDKADRPHLINPRGSLEPGNLVFLEQIVDAACQAGYNVILGRLHPAQIEFWRTNGNAQIGKRAILCLSKLFRCVEQRL